jgi:hypothetical protein
MIATSIGPCRRSAAKFSVIAVSPAKGRADSERRRRSLYCASAPPDEPFKAALSKTPERIALREIGETFVLPL